MLNYLKLENVGPPPKMEIDFKPRMNFLTGDNGLGKTFLLDIAWWVLTRTWARSPATPPRRGWKTPEGTAQRHFVDRVRPREGVGRSLQERVDFQPL